MEQNITTAPSRRVKCGLLACHPSQPLQSVSKDQLLDCQPVRHPRNAAKACEPCCMQQAEQPPHAPPCRSGRGRIRRGPGERHRGHHLGPRVAGRNGHSNRRVTHTTSCGHAEARRPVRGRHPLDFLARHRLALRSN
eukprot:356256-Chlamydomonas_euryale.AAC.6